MNITVITVGKLKEKFFKEAVSEYLKRLSRFCKVEIIEIPDEKIPDNASLKEIEAIKNKEGEKILRHVRGNTYFITMCIEGRELSSEELADKLSAAAMNFGHVTLAIGGSLGLSDEVKNASAFRLSFGKITLPHQLMRIVLAEQLYRAFKINAGEAYHK